MEELTFKLITLYWKIFDIGGDLPTHSGIYQIYGDSFTYGTNSLLYIGQAVNLRERVKQHINGQFIGRQKGLSLRLAEVDKELLTIAESILIAVHKPSMNTEYIASPAPLSDLYMIQNHGERGVLNIQLTNSYWVLGAKQYPK